jgi:hypothetical protein
MLILENPKIIARDVTVIDNLDWGTTEISYFPGFVQPRAIQEK